MTPARVVPLRRPGLWLSSAIVVVLAAALAISVWNNPHIDHAAIAQFQFAPAILAGLRLTIVLALLAALIGLVLGVVLAIMRLSASPVLRLFSGTYTWLLRGTPLLVQILLWGNLALLFQHIGPFDTNRLITPFVASVIALGLNEGAYMAEIV
ncbi:MAG TPA: ABC transporter permease subunit, partial [Caldimonas sp.]|nr:ABC transporter permease subunit [Caldimonas sp.]